MASERGQPPATRPVLMGPPPIPKTMPVWPDSHFRNEKISGLNVYNFYEFIPTKEKVLIFFYNSKDAENCCSRETEFVNVAEKRVPAYHAFAAVDCFTENHLCAQEGIRVFPTIKLYSNGFELSKLEDTNTLTAYHMEMLMQKTPVLNKPRAATDSTAQAVEESKKKIKMGASSLRR